MSSLSTRSFSRNQKKFLYYLEEYDNSITKYYNIDNPFLTITFNPCDDFYVINIVYDRKEPIFEFPMLPHEINKKINDYTKCNINITLNVKNSIRFPLTSPIWELKDIKYNIPTGIHINIKEYYEYLVNLHNENYTKNKNWVPGMQYINSDLLNFIMIVNTFDYM